MTKDGTWFFTISIVTTVNKSATKIDRQIVVGQLARIPRKGAKIEVLLRIDNFISFPENNENESKIQMSVGGNFQSGDLIILRMLPPDRDIFITLYGIHESEERNS